MNLYALFRDLRVWTDPTHFNPEANFPLCYPKRATAMEHLIPFGIGKRACLGETFKRQAIFLLFTGLMRTFRVVADPGFPLPLEDTGTQGITRGPLPYKVRFIPRAIWTNQIL